MSNVAWEGHEESKTSSTYFYGETSRARIQRAFNELNVEYTSGYGEIVVTARDSADIAVKAWLNSPVHCKIIMNPNYKNAGAGHSYAPADVSQNKWGNSWTVDFGY